MEGNHGMTMILDERVRKTTEVDDYMHYSALSLVESIKYQHLN